MVATMLPRRAIFRPRLSLRIAAALLGPVLAAACDDEVAARTQAPLPVVRAIRVESGPDVRETRYPGVIRAHHEVDHAFRIDGRLDSRPVEVGSRVVKGQVLATLDPIDLELAIATAEAEHASARAALDQAQTHVDRMRRLLARNATSQAAFDQGALAAEEALGRLTRAERQHDLAVNKRAHATLTAAFDGTVSAVSADVGDVVEIADPVVRVAGTDRLEVEVAVPERALADLDDARATVGLWARPDEVHEATLAEITPDADPITRTFTARFAVADKNLPLGMSATVVLTHGDGRPVVRLPLSAVVDQGTGASVYLVDPRDNALIFRPVTVARFTSSDVIVSDGLKPGDQVVTLGLNRLVPGLHVRVADAE